MGVLKISDQTLGEVEALAREGARPVDQFAELLIREALAHRRDRQAMVERMREVRAMTPSGVEQTDSVALLREDRDR
ncbi:hypothetical protein [Prosthecomicrobium sp. N25]|uniref:hypothetical protein n=1 Tax=Prosthecomicrobium sp. N25 TaxID=3129254 RepID=UPI0030773FA4